MMNNKKRFTGIIPPLVTPLTRDEALDQEAAQKLISYCRDHKASGVFVNGTSGEAMRTSDSVWEALTKTAIPYDSNGFSVFCGAIDSTTARVIERLKRIEDMGGKLAVCTAPFYLPNFEQDEILRHFDRICNSTNLEIAVYNIPDTTHVNILPATIAHLAEYEKIVVYKDSCADWQQVQRTIYCLKEKDISFFNGAEELCAVSMLYGAQGCIPGLANFFPEMFVNLHQVCMDGKIEESSRIQEKICGIRECLFAGPAWITVMKYLVSVFGFGTDTVSWPLPTMNEEQKARVIEILKREGIDGV